MWISVSLCPDVLYYACVKCVARWHIVLLHCSCLLTVWQKESLTKSEERIIVFCCTSLYANSSVWTPATGI